MKYTCVCVGGGWKFWLRQWCLYGLGLCISFYLWITYFNSPIFEVYMVLLISFMSVDCLDVCYMF